MYVTMKNPMNKMQLQLLQGLHVASPGQCCMGLLP